MSKAIVARPGRNEPCRCGSGRKYKHCCLDKDESAARAAYAKASVEAATESSPDADAGRVSKRAPKHQTQQPWKATNTRGAHQRVRTPRKVGGS